jgi:predicted methyltransferase
MHCSWCVLDWGEAQVSQLLSQEQDFRCYGCSGTGHDVQELQSIPQQFPEDSKDRAEATLPNASR